jgi:hypothetical protein
MLAGPLNQGFTIFGYFSTSLLCVHKLHAVFKGIYLLQFVGMVILVTVW